MCYAEDQAGLNNDKDRHFKTMHLNTVKFVSLVKEGCKILLYLCDQVRRTAKMPPNSRLKIMIQKFLMILHEHRNKSKFKVLTNFFNKVIVPHFRRNL